MTNVPSRQLGEKAVSARSLGRNVPNMNATRFTSSVATGRGARPDRLLVVGQYLGWRIVVTHQPVDDSHGQPVRVSHGFDAAHPLDVANALGDGHCRGRDHRSVGH